MGGGAQPDYNQNDVTTQDYIQNRPGCFKCPTGFLLIFDGNTDGLDTMQFKPNETYYKISDETPYFEQLIGCDITLNDHPKKALYPKMFDGFLCFPLRMSLYVSIVMVYGV